MRCGNSRRPCAIEGARPRIHSACQCNPLRSMRVRHQRLCKQPNMWPHRGQAVDRALILGISAAPTTTRCVVSKSTGRAVCFCMSEPQLIDPLSNTRAHCFHARAESQHARARVHRASTFASTLDAAVHMGEVRNEACTTSKRQQHSQATALRAPSPNAVRPRAVRCTKQGGANAFDMPRRPPPRASLRGQFCGCEFFAW